jgi:hypothetical protein
VTTAIATSYYRRLAQRSLASLLRYKFLHEYGYDKGAVVVAAIVEDICTVVRNYFARPGDLGPGQLVYYAPARGERGGRGKTMAATRLLPVRLSIVADEDYEALGQDLSSAARRELRVRRLVHEAYDQGALLSGLDVAVLIGCSPGSVSNTAKALRQRGEILPLRGYLEDMGSWPTHKAAIVRLYLEGLTTPDIAARTYHSKEAVDRYLKGFERVRLLAPKFAREELPLLTGMLPTVISQYLELIDTYGLAPSKNRAPRREKSPASS